jgi:hypothetical protein
MKKEIPVQNISELPPKTRDEALARLHFHFPEIEAYTVAKGVYSTYSLSVGIAEAYYGTLSKKESIYKRMRKNEAR